MYRDASGQVKPDAPDTGWTVTAQQEQVGIGADGRATNGYRIQFTTGKGVNGSVFIPMDRYNPTNVKAAIAAHAHQLDEVQGLTG